MLDFIELEMLDTEVVTSDDVVRRAAALRSAADAPASAFEECGQAFVSFGMLTEAIGAYSEALVRDPQSVRAYLGRAQTGYGLLLLSGENPGGTETDSQVVHDFRRALELSRGESREAVLGFGSALLVMNRFAECASWIQEQLGTGDKNHEGDLLYLFALCRLFSGDLDQAIEYANKMDRVAGFEAERLLLRGFVSWLRNEKDQLIEYRAALQLRDVKLVQVLAAIESGAKYGTFLEFARLYF